IRSACNPDFRTEPHGRSTRNTWNGSPQRELTTNTLSGKLGADQNPENLTGRQEVKLAWIEKTHPYHWRAYPLKAGPRLPFQLKGEEDCMTTMASLSEAMRGRCRRPSRGAAAGLAMGRRLPADFSGAPQSKRRGRLRPSGDGAGPNGGAEP